MEASIFVGKIEGCFGFNGQCVQQAPITKHRSTMLHFSTSLIPSPSINDTEQRCQFTVNDIDWEIVWDFIHQRVVVHDNKGTNLHVSANISSKSITTRDVMDALGYREEYTVKDLWISNDKCEVNTMTVEEALELPISSQFICQFSLSL